MRTLLLALWLITATSFGSVHSKILKTFWVHDDPQGLELEIKNIDLVVHETNYNAFHGVAYELYIYLWVKPDLGPNPENLKVVDWNNPFNESYAYTTRVGKDPNGYYVYQLRMRSEEHFRHAFYAAFLNAGQLVVSHRNSDRNLVRIEN